MQVPFIPFMLKEITIKCCLTYTDEEFRGVVDAFVAGTYTSQNSVYLANKSCKGKFKGLETMVTSKIHIDDIVQKGFNELVANRDQHVKILVTPDRSKV
jgi:(R,R)-butanediol dehydrogenase/meso-butanediol dehydrogenase/diacetyl reductase